MRKNKIYELFLKNEIIEGLNEKYNYEFDINNNKEFEKEYLKFIYTYNYFFYSSTEKAIFTFINSYPCFIEEKQIDFLMKLIDVARINKKEDYEELIYEFLLSYYNSLDKYRKIEGIIAKDINIYKRILIKKIDIDKITEKVINFYNKIIKYAVTKKIKISILEKERMSFNIKKKIRNNKNAENIINQFIEDKVGLNSLIDYDYVKEKHIKNYQKYCLEEELYGYTNDAVLKVFKIITKSKLCDESFIKTFINRIIEKTNYTIEMIGNYDENYIQTISSIEELIKDLNMIKSNNSINKLYREKIVECIQKLLYAKRCYIKSRKYKENMSSIKTELKIPKKEIDKIKKDVSINFSKLYNYTRIDFTKELEHAINSYSEHALLYHVKRINIYENEVYRVESKYKIKMIYKEYFDSIGKKYINNNYKKLLNILGKDYYETMLSYLKNNYSIQINLLASILMDSIADIKNNINSARLYKKICIDNLYEEMMAQIIGIESNIFKLSKDKKIRSKNIESMLEKLFELYKNNDLYRNGIMYIYYILYCKDGFELRNKVAHGELLYKKNYTVELLMIYSCMIIINYIVGIEVNGN